jgi:hypothetical protein
MLELEAKRRAVIPAAVHREAEIELGETLIVQAKGPGRIVLETPAALQARVWAAAPSIASRRTPSDMFTRSVTMTTASVSKQRGSGEALT